MQAQRYADAVMIEMNALASSVDYDSMALYWRIDWAVLGIAGSIDTVGVDVSVDLLNDLADNEKWIQLTLRHISEELRRPVNDRARIFSIDSDGRYMGRVTKHSTADPVDWDFE